MNRAKSITLRQNGCRFCCEKSVSVFLLGIFWLEDSYLLVHVCENYVHGTARVGSEHPRIK